MMTFEGKDYYRHFQNRFESIKVLGWYGMAEVCSIVDKINIIYVESIDMESYTHDSLNYKSSRY